MRSRPGLRQAVVRFAQAEAATHQGVTGAPFTEDEAVGCHFRQSDPLAAREQALHERSGIDLAADRPETSDDGGFSKAINAHHGIGNRPGTGTPHLRIEGIAPPEGGLAEGRFQGSGGVRVRSHMSRWSVDPGKPTV